MSDTPLQTLAATVRKEFVRDTRDNGQVFFHRKDQPFEDDWIQRLIYDAHGDFLPDDFRYEQIVSALDDFSNSDDPQEAIDQIEPAVYNSARVQWLASDLRRGTYCDDALSEYADVDGIYQLIGLGMETEICEVYESVLQSLHDHLNKEDQEAEDD